MSVNASVVCLPDCHHFSLGWEQQRVSRVCGVDGSGETSEEEREKKTRKE